MVVSLCEDCRDFFQRNHHDGRCGDESWRRFHDSENCERPISRLIQTAVLGCGVCETVVCKFGSLNSDLLTAAQKNGESSTFKLRIEENFNTNLQWQDDIDIPFLCVLISQQEIKFRLWRVSEKHKADRGANDDNGSTGSESSFMRAEEWLRICIQNHDNCNASDPSGNWVPSRLLDLGPTTNTFPTTIKLRQTDSWQRSVQYTTLSHCGGSVRPSKLLRTNLQEFMDAISMDAIPRTFQDAIYATWRLGFQYLWIDSLCIIQDSKDDWNFESSLMAQVYSGCVLNLAAVSSNNSTGGLFQSRPPSYLGPRFISVESMQDGFKSYYQLWDKSVWPATFEFAKLNTRAWVMQERLLSPRTLGFTESQLFWECRCNRSCEEFPSGYPSELFERWQRDFPQPGLQGKLKIHSLSHYADGRFQDDRGRRLSLAWHNLVMDYSKNSITYEQDKLPAISGLASLFAQQLGTAYHAGLWSSTLLSDLLWTANPGDYAVNRPLEYRAPLWSWASVKCPVEYLPGWVESPEVTVIAAEAHPVIERCQFGKVSGGFIRLRGRLIDIITVVPHHGNSYAFQVRSCKGHSIAAECTPDQSLGPADTQPELFYLPVGYYINTTRARGDRLYVGLVLLADEVQRRGYYKRWGMVKTQWGSWSDDSSNQAPCHRYTDDLNGTIVLV
ncbi:unnamed protein product [Fusarium equiseti]|uniref:Heterokaryon incompatibility domain-containing protein n=1 Tax=Fusarium equiseti TaxID=61235 RepID=A0A8J2IH28_FUSEQ|nr:unnamed protein product [Fusarium equiseti]